MSAKIKKIQAREILDSRGEPTVEVRVELIGGVIGVAAVPSGKSKGTYEALEIRDNDASRYDGKGALRACENVNKIIAKELKGKNVTKQQNLDQIMITLDGTLDKSRLGANAILGVSLACARAGANAKKMPLYKYISKIYQLPTTNYQLPIPMFNIFNGGKHADTNLNFQEFMIVPHKTKSFSEAVRIGTEIFYCLKKVLKAKNFDTDVADEGGFAPDVEASKQAPEMIIEAIEKAGYRAGKDVYLALDAGASTFLNTKENQYVLSLDKVSLTSERLGALYIEWAKRYHFFSFEDGFSENDWQTWSHFLVKIKELFPNSLILAVADDLTATNKKRLERAIKDECANAIIIKPNQVGTLTETIEVIKIAQKANWKIIVSNRSGETCDTFISDLAVATRADYIKAGSLSRGERVVKYNRLMEIEMELKK